MTNLSNVSRSLHVQVQLALPCKDVQLCVQYTTEERSFMHFFPAENNPENNTDNNLITQGALNTVTDYTTRTRGWISENLGGRNLRFVGVIVIAGALGFLLGRRGARTMAMSEAGRT